MVRSWPRVGMSLVGRARLAAVLTPRNRVRRLLLWTYVTTLMLVNA